MKRRAEDLEDTAGSRRVYPGSQLANLLLDVFEDGLGGDIRLLAILCRTGDYVVFSKVRERFTHPDFIDFLLKWANSASRG